MDTCKLNSGTPVIGNEPNINPGDIASNSCQDSLCKIWVALAVGGYQVVPDPRQVSHAGVPHEVLHSQHDSWDSLRYRSKRCCMLRDT